MGLTTSSQKKEQTHSGCVPAVATLASPDTRQKMKANAKVLVVGSGCAGLAAAWHLNRAGVNVTIYESLGELGGHANTINVDGVDVDTGFMVYNALNYPHLCAFFEEMGIQGEKTTMGFSVSIDDGKLEWCSDSLSGLLATPSNAWNPAFYTMMKDIMRFNTLAKALLTLPDEDSKKQVTVREFLSMYGLSQSFRDMYLIPMTAAIWSATSDDMLGFPAATLFTFLDNHLLLQVSEHIDWQTPSKRSRQYVNAIFNELNKSQVFVNTHVQRITRVLQDDDKSYKIIVTSTQKKSTLDTDKNEGYLEEKLSEKLEEILEEEKVEEFDYIIFACHPDQTLAILASEASTEEKALLGAFHYAENDTYVHSDETLMPKSKSAWTSWNYLGTTSNTTSEKKPVFVTYWLNKLQNLSSHPRDIFVSLNPTISPKLEKTFARLSYAHPQYSLTAVQAQQQIAQMLQGAKSTFYCGAWMGYGFHEDGFRSGLEVAMSLCAVSVPWIKNGQFTVSTSSTSTTKNTISKSQKESLKQVVKSPQNSTFLTKQGSQVSTNTWGSLFTRPLISLFATFCQSQVIAFMKQGFDKGKLTLLLPYENHRKVEICGKEPGEDVVVVINKASFFVRLALEADLGMARSYIAGEWEVVNSGSHSNGLTKLLQLLIDNMPTGKTKVTGGIDVRGLLTAWAGSFMNALWFRITMDNTIANSRSNIHAHYDLSNDLFTTFLDNEYMMYSSALFTTRVIPPTTPGAPEKLEFLDTLEEAQIRKIDALLQRLEPITHDMELLDIGFGWGGICIRAAEKYGCHVTGITLSTEQKALAEEKVRAKGLTHLITFVLMDYRVFANLPSNKAKFDRIVSCEMIEAVGHNYLGSFFEAVENILKTDGIFVMQAITMPESRYPVYVKTADFINTIIFPGGCCPSLSALLNAMAVNSMLHLDTATNTNLHYAETLRRWRARFNDNLPRVYALGFDDTFIRLWNLYFCYCEAGFENQVINLQILTFSRPGNPNLVKCRMVKDMVVNYAV